MNIYMGRWRETGVKGAGGRLQGERGRQSAERGGGGLGKVFFSPGTHSIRVRVYRHSPALHVLLASSSFKESPQNLSDPNRSDFESQIASDCNRNSKTSL